MRTTSSLEAAHVRMSLFEGSSPINVCRNCNPDVIPQTTLHLVIHHQIVASRICPDAVSSFRVFVDVDQSFGIGFTPAYGL